jgi:hypothetical protein
MPAHPERSEAKSPRQDAERFAQLVRGMAAVAVPSNEGA